MQSVVIISLENSSNELLDLLNGAGFGNNLLEKEVGSYMLIQKKSFYKINITDESTEDFLKIKSDFIDFFSEVETNNKEIKLKLLDYLTDSKGAISVFCEKGFNQDGLNLLDKLSKLFKGIIFSGGVFVNSDHKVIFAFDGTSESDDFWGQELKVEDDKIENYNELKKKDEKSLIEKVKDLKLLVNENLPSIDEIQDINFRTKEEICRRTLCLIFIASYAEGVVETNEIRQIRKFFLNMLKEYNLISCLTEKEMNFLYEYRPPKNQLIEFIWEYEGAYTLMWALGLVDNLKFPPVACAANELVEIVKKYPSFEEFFEVSVLRSEEDIIEAYELAYRTQRAVNDTEALGRIIPGDIDLNVIKERDKAFQWLTGNRNLNWDKL